MNNPPRQPSTPTQQPSREPADARQQGEDLQPPPTGANGGSPAAPVMKQTAKTPSESTGRS
jgi:hypothetical protein